MPTLQNGAGAMARDHGMARQSGAACSVMRRTPLRLMPSCFPACELQCTAWDARGGFSYLTSIASR